MASAGTKRGTPHQPAPRTSPPSLPLVVILIAWRQTDRTRPCNLCRSLSLATVLSEPTLCPRRAQASGYSRLVTASRGVRASHDHPAGHSGFAISSWFPSWQCGFDSRHPLHTRKALQEQQLRLYLSSRL